MALPMEACESKEPLLLPHQPSNHKSYVVYSRMCTLVTMQTFNRNKFIFKDMRASQNYVKLDMDRLKENNILIIKFL